MLVIITKHDRHFSELFFGMSGLERDIYAAVVYIFVKKKKRINFKNIPTKISHKLSLIESMK